MKPVTNRNRVRIAAALALLAATAAATAAPTWTLDLNLVSVHAQAWARRDLNQKNYGLGATDHFSDTWAISGGWYRNSFRRTSAYALVDWTPMRLSLPAGWRVRAGLTAGLDSGYRRAEIPTRPLIAAGLVRVVAPRGWAVDLDVVPSAGSACCGFVGVQLAVPI